jgi:hypothetical protein
LLVKMNRQEFESLDLKKLGWRCMAPIMEPLCGKNPSEKTQVYSELTGGQQVLFMFYAYYNHAYKSIAEFYFGGVLIILLNRKCGPRSKPSYKIFKTVIYCGYFKRQKQCFRGGLIQEVLMPLMFHRAPSKMIYRS